MCAETVPWRCHRNLVADALAARGIPVTHIMSASNLYAHIMTRFARVRDGEVTYPADDVFTQRSISSDRLTAMIREENVNAGHLRRRNKAIALNRAAQRVA